MVKSTPNFLNFDELALPATMPPVASFTFSGNHAGTPLYKEVRRYVLSRLNSGDWKPGQKIPPELELAKHLNVAISTVRAGIKDLAAEGLLIRRQGKGTYVGQHDFQSQHFRYSNIYSDRNEKIITSREILSIKRMQASRDVEQELQLHNQKSVAVHSITALLNVEERPIACMQLILPVWLFPKLKIEDLRQSNVNLYTVYQQMHGVTVVRMEERVHARGADPVFARRVGARVGEPVLHVHRVAYTFNNVPVELRLRTYKAAGYHYLFRHKALD